MVHFPTTLYSLQREAKASFLTRFTEEQISKDLHLYAADQEDDNASIHRNTSGLFNGAFYIVIIYLSRSETWFK